VQLLITGGVRSKPNSATGRGILVIDENWGYIQEYRGAKTSPLARNPAIVKGSLVTGEKCRCRFNMWGAESTPTNQEPI